MARSPTQKARSASKLASITRRASPLAEITSSTRTNLIDAAHNILRSRSSIDVTLLELGQHAKANPALIGYYFGGKEQLLVALMERALSFHLELFQDIRQMQINPEAKLRKQIAAFIDLYFLYPYIDRLVTHVIEASPRSKAERIATRFTRPVIDGLLETIKEGVDTGSFKNVDHTMLYYSIVGISQRIFTGRYSLKVMFSINEIDEKYKTTFTDHVASLIVEGIRLRRSNEIEH